MKIIYRPNIFTKTKSQSFDYLEPMQLHGSSRCDLKSLQISNFLPEHHFPGKVNFLENSRFLLVLCLNINHPSLLEKKPCYLCVEFHQLQKKSNQRVEIAFIKFVGRSKWCQIQFCIIIFTESVAPYERNNLKNVNYTKLSKLQLLILYRRNLNSVDNQQC